MPVAALKEPGQGGCRLNYKVGLVVVPLISLGRSLVVLLQLNACINTARRDTELGVEKPFWLSATLGTISPQWQSHTSPSLDAS